MKKAHTILKYYCMSLRNRRLEKSCFSNNFSNKISNILKENFLFPMIFRGKKAFFHDFDEIFTRR